MFSLLLLVCTFPANPACGDDAPASEAFFEERIRPLLSANCFECHSAARGKHKGGLELDSAAGFAAGGDLGPLLDPEQPEHSLLLRAISYQDQDLSMPPDGPLAAAEVAALEAWVAVGAPWPAAGAVAVPEAASAPDPRAAHWAFQPRTRPEPPSVHNAGWVHSAIDRFVLAELEAHGLEPAAPSSRRALLVRATFDLTGLAPTPQELTDFEADTSPAAFERVVERLLASPHYGERWARRWLDLARYADSNGLDENLALANAWRYRDWVVDAFNRDLPYDQFLTQQIAGDLLPIDPESPDLGAWIATGFLSLGPKMLAEQDKQKLVMDVIDEQVDVVGKTFLGLTLGCARCHDHKFDPITQRDYTALAGIFKSTSTLANTDFVSRWRERELAAPAALAARTQALEAAEQARLEAEQAQQQGRASLLPRWKQEFVVWAERGERLRAAALAIEAEDFLGGNAIRDDSTYATPQVVIARSEQPGRQSLEYALQSSAGGAHWLLVRCAAEESRPVQLWLNGAPLAGEFLGATTGGWMPADQRWMIATRLDLAAGENRLRLEREGPLPHLDALLLVPEAAVPAWWDVPEVALGWAGELYSAARVGQAALELVARALTTPAADFSARLEALASEARLASDPECAALLAGAPAVDARALLERWLVALCVQDSTAARLGAAASPAELAAHSLLSGERGPFHLEAARGEALWPQAERSALAAARARRDQLLAAVPAPFDRALGVIDGELQELPLQVRGSHLNPGPTPIPRGVPLLVAAYLPAPVMPQAASGRLELAQWMTDPAHPLTARVMANRVWSALFSTGLVSSSSNFGLRGDLPANPELLDWLATRLVDLDWSLKSLQRELLLSSTYAMGTASAQEALALDPGNRHQWRHNRRRLEAEELRDRVLQVAGTLDLSLGGTLLKTANGDYVTNDQSRDNALYDSTRRSLYLPIIRNSIYDLYGTFDYGDPSTPLERRNATVVATQALVFMNSPLVIDAAEALAQAAAAHTGGDALATDAERVADLFGRVLLRTPDTNEQRLCAEFLADERRSGASETRALRGLAQMLLSSNEFLYLD